MSVIFGRMVSASLIFLFFIKRFLRLKFTKEDIYILSYGLFKSLVYYFIFEAKALEFNSWFNKAGIVNFLWIGFGITGIRGAGNFLVKKKGRFYQRKALNFWWHFLGLVNGGLANLGLRFLATR